MEREYGRLKRAYGEMSFCWQETAAEEWHRRRLYLAEKERTKENERKLWLGDGMSADRSVLLLSGYAAGSGR